MKGFEMTKPNETTRERLLSSAEKLVMANGFAGTTIDDILKDAGLTKGAFFHYFKGKSDMARALIEWHALRDLGFFDAWMAEAEAASDDPLAQMLTFLKIFEDHATGFDDPAPGCIYAAYTYESMQFEPSVREFVADTLRQWTSIYVRKFQEVLDSYKPAIPITARQLGEMIVAILEGGLVLQRAYEDKHMTARQSEQFRNYLKLLFGEPKTKKKKTAAKEYA
jgi:TetR/AcrR family transcriptional repressor of nem operon